ADGAPAAVEDPVSGEGTCVGGHVGYLATVPGGRAAERSAREAVDAQAGLIARHRPEQRDAAAARPAGAVVPHRLADRWAERGERRSSHAGHERLARCIADREVGTAIARF